ncbi:hypothetical protein [Xanthomonas phage XPP9]|nr:hypothetical protein [Xanthomonas phage XPP9]
MGVFIVQNVVLARLIWYRPSAFTVEVARFCYALATFAKLLILFDFT